MNEASPTNSQLLEKHYRASVIAVSVQFDNARPDNRRLAVITIPTTTFPSSFHRFVGTILLIAAGSFVFDGGLLFSWERLKIVALLKGNSRTLGNLQANRFCSARSANVVAIMGFLVATLSGNKLRCFAPERFR